MEQEVTSLGSFHYNYVKVLSYYEHKIKQGSEWTFRHHLLPKASKRNITQDTSLQQLVTGTNNGTCITLTVVRAMHLSNSTFCLCTAQRPFSLDTLLVLALPYPSHQPPELPQINSRAIGKKTVIKIHQPFKVKQQPQIIPTLIAPLINCQLLKPKPQPKVKRTSQQLRQQANTFFKAKRYVEAIHLYENTLSSITQPDPRTLSILYSNAAASLFELRLYSSCKILSEVAILMDPTYNKGYYRKLRAILELKGFQLATSLLLSISNLLPKPDLDSLYKNFTYLHSQSTGVFNWRGLLKETIPQGEYSSQKVDFTFVDNQLRYYARQPIKQHQLLLISKPFIYIQQTSHNFKDSFMSFLKQVQIYYLYDQKFQQLIHTLPCKCHPTLTQRDEYYQQFKQQAKPMPKKQLFNKMQRCIFEEKSLNRFPEENGYGIWKEMFYFNNRCYPNCTSVHINGHLLVSALQSIQAGSVLSIDLISGVQASKRKQTLRIKMQKQCDCQFCQGIQLTQNNFNTIQQLYDQIQLLQSIRKKKHHIWSIINNQMDRLTFFEGDYTHLIYYYIYYVEKECQWDDFLNLVRLKEEIDHEEANRHLDQVGVRLLDAFLKCGEEEAAELYQIVLIKHGIVEEYQS